MNRLTVEEIQALVVENQFSSSRTVRIAFRQLLDIMRENERLKREIIAMTIQQDNLILHNDIQDAISKKESDNGA